MKLKVAILGVGRWGVHFIRNFLEHPQAELVAIVDRSEEILKSSQQRFQLDPNQVLITTDWQQLQELSDLDAIVVATPATTHYSIIQSALSSGYHVLAEKPLTLDPQECIELSDLAKSEKLQLLVDHTYLFNSAVAKGKEVITNQEIGNLRYGYATRTHLSPVRQDVDALWDLAIHDISIFNYWLGEVPIRVQARGQVWLQPNNTMPISKQKGLADTVWVTLDYESGFRATIHLSWLNPDKQRRLCVVGDRGTLIFDELNQESPLTMQQGYFTQEGTRFIPQGLGQKTIDVIKNEPLGQVCDRFIQNILNQANDDFSSGKVGAELVKILRGLTLSLEQEGKVIDIRET